MKFNIYVNGVYQGSTTNHVWPIPVELPGGPFTWYVEVSTNDGEVTSASEVWSAGLQMGISVVLPRPSSYDPTLDWSWEDGVWGDYPLIEVKGGGRYKNNVVVIGELDGDGVIYIG